MTDRMENIKGWNIDLKAVYGRRWGEKIKFHASEDLWESADGSVAGLLYGIAEVGISKEIGCLAVFRNKEAPVLAFDLPWLKCWYLYELGVQFGKNDYLFVHRFISDRGRSGERQSARPCVLDLAAGRFAPIDGLPGECSRVRHAGGTEYGFVNSAQAGSEEIIVDLKALPWRRLRGGWWDRFLL